MAIYSFNVRGISPSRKQSALAAAAYQSGQALVDESTGETLRYSREERVAASGIEVPDGAPEWASDRQRLWNEASKAHTGGTALVAQRIMGALPRELSLEEQVVLVKDWCKVQTAKGYACDWAIHDSGDGNPHVHILKTKLRIDGEGFVVPEKPKNEKCYLLRNAAGDERMSPAIEWKAMKAEGWEKVFRYDKGRDELRLTKTEAKALGLTNQDRLSTSPVATMRAAGASDEDPTALGAAKEELKAERKLWADVTNAVLAKHAARTGEKPVTIDHRSNAERGLKTVPTSHEGYRVGRIEREARARAEAEGREYEPVTAVRARNVEVTRLNKRIVDGLRKLARLVYVYAFKARRDAQRRRIREAAREVKVVFDADATVAEVMDALVAEASKAERDEPVWKNDKTVDTVAQGATAQDFLRHFGGSSQGGSGQSLRHRSV